MRQVVDQEQELAVPARMSTDMYFSADVETDGPIPGPFSLLSFAFVCAGTFDGVTYKRESYSDSNRFYCELKPISDRFEPEALRVNGLDRLRLVQEGVDPAIAMTEAASWVSKIAGNCRPVLVAYPLSFDWSWLYWYFVKFARAGSPFSYSQCFDLKTAYAVKSHRPISEAGRSKLLHHLRAPFKHSHHALDDALEQAEIFANIFEWSGTT